MTGQAVQIQVKDAAGPSWFATELVPSHKKAPCGFYTVRPVLCGGCRNPVETGSGDPQKNAHFANGFITAATDKSALTGCDTLHVLA